MVGSSYASVLPSWLRVFPREQFLFIDSVKLIDEPWKVLEKVESFLGLEHEVTKSK